MIEIQWREVQMVSISKISMKIFYIAISIVFGIVGFSGCSSLQEGLASQMEVPTLENQANRVAVGMTIVRENNIMAFKMPISADAKWPALVASDINETTKKIIDNALMDDPYFATQHYTKYLQRKMLGCNQSLGSLGGYANITATIFDQSVSPLTYRAFQKIIIFYGKDKENWPNIFNYDSSLDNFLDFKDGNLQDIDSPTGDVYPTLGEAVISLAPVNLQKDLDAARLEMLDGFGEVASYKAQIGSLESELKRSRETKNVKKLSDSERLKLEDELEVLKEKALEVESATDEKELIYFQLLDQMAVAIQSDIDLDDENYVKLARNINIVAKEIYTGSTQAYSSFAIALGNLASNNIILNFPKEIESLALAKANVPLNLQSKYNQRIGRVVKNALYLFPNVFIGTYYASKQLSLARKYENITELILVANETKKAQETAKKEDEKSKQK